jgi:hypothetical protein
VSWQSFVIGIAPFVVALAGLIVAAFWGKQVLDAKNAQLAAKDDQLAAKDEQVKTLLLMSPERVVENIRALHAYYEVEANLTKGKLEDARNELAAAGTERQGLREEISGLRERLQIFEFGAASTASAVFTSTSLSLRSLAALMETITDTYEPTDTLTQVGVDEDDLPIYTDGRKVMNHREAQEYLVEEGLADPETLKDD